MRNRIELFIERNCQACKEVVLLLRRLSTMYTVDLHVYHRDEDTQLFHERGIFICPATFLNGRLEFYGSYTIDALVPKLTFTQSHYKEDAQ